MRWQRIFFAEFGLLVNVNKTRSSTTEWILKSRDSFPCATSLGKKSQKNLKLHYTRFKTPKRRNNF